MMVGRNNENAYRGAALPAYIITDGSIEKDDMQEKNYLLVR